MRSAACALATSSRCSDSVSVPMRAPSAFDLVADRRHRDGPLLTLGGQHVAVLRRGPDHLTQPGGQLPAGVGDRGGHRCRVLPCGAGLLGAHPRLTFRGRGTTQRIRFSTNGIGAFFGGAHR